MQAADGDPGPGNGILTTFRQGCNILPVSLSGFLAAVGLTLPSIELISRTLFIICFSHLHCLRVPGPCLTATLWYLLFCFQRVNTYPTAQTGTKELSFEWALTPPFTKPWAPSELSFQHLRIPLQEGSSHKPSCLLFSYTNIIYLLPHKM